LSSLEADQPDLLDLFRDKENECEVSLFVTDVSAIKRSLRRIHERSPQYGEKLSARLGLMDLRFFDRAERFLLTFERFLAANNKTLEYGVDCFMALREEMTRERMEFLRTGRYSSSSFAEVEQRVYSNPQIMEYHMYGLLFSQFFWPEQYARLDFFCDELRRCGDRVHSYLELGGGHAVYIASAVDILAADTRFDLVDISATSIEMARGMLPNDRIHYNWCNVFDFPDERKYDFVVAGEIIEHLEDPRKLLAHIRRMLTPQGRAFISTPVNSATVDHIYLFNNVREIRELLLSEGLAIESETTRYSEDMPDFQAEKLKVAQMFAAVVTADS
jgi:SAM-dependent methyltransferase